MAHLTKEHNAMKIANTRWMVEKMFQNRGWVLVKKNGKNILCKRF